MTDDSGAEHEEKSRGFGCAIVALVMCVCGLLLLPFLPLFLAGLEGALFRTDKVEDACRYVGIHDELTTLYEAVFRLFK